jgi:SRSO17 transposase
MDRHRIADGADRFAAYIEELTGVIGHADRRRRCAIIAPGCWRRRAARALSRWRRWRRRAGFRCSIRSCCISSTRERWSDERVLAKVRELVVPKIERHGPIKAWIVVDTGFPKQAAIRSASIISIGAAWQAGQWSEPAPAKAGVAVTLSIANRHASLPIAYQLYLPKDWAEDAARRNKAHVPEAIRFRTKPQIALAQMRAALAAGVAPGVVLMDASYGTNTALRTGSDALGLTYVAAILPTVKVRAASDPELRVSVKELALLLPQHDWRTITWRTLTWREGSAAPLRSRLARLRVRIAPARGAAGRPEETLPIGWPEGEAAPTKYWLSNLGNKISFRALVDIAKMRWRIERDYQDLKQEIGLVHYEGRGWRGFHHHGTLCIAAYAPVYAGAGLRKGDDSPLSTWLPPELRETCHFRSLPTPRRRRSGPNGDC